MTSGPTIPAAALGAMGVCVVDGRTGGPITLVRDALVAKLAAVGALVGPTTVRVPPLRAAEEMSRVQLNVSRASRDLIA